ncbi:MAG TPA: methionine--tRNA ligase, partial [Sediminispirochaeta sp.]|nr:methionine--tRNA ligase [Sediminispirochaeta sp.]
MKKRRLITSALPYVNNIPHLGNLIQVLSADVFARFCRSAGYETLYVCGTDEYGTATETKALEEGVSPKELCDRFYKVHDDIYRWFGIDFDHFGRTSRPEQTEIVQDIFKKADANGYIFESTIEQLYCESCQRFLADRYVRGTCPHCGYPDARGDQCEDCGKLLDPTELVEPRCGTCGAKPVLKETKHLYLDLPAILPKLQAWMDRASVEGFWARNAIQMTKSWIRDGLKERAITRDLKWGIPVPKEGFEGKVFYVWFDAPIGYISITKDLTEQWEYWWKRPEEVELFQFIGKDNIPFHTVIFPSSLLATGENWTMLHHMSSTEYLNYESGKFSKSKGVGVFGTDAKETGIPADVWRFYIFYNRPEKADALFTWDDFQEKVNGELIGNLANLVNRTLSFLSRFYKGEIPRREPDPAFVEEVRRREAIIGEALERAELREAFRQIFALSSYGNREFQAGEPWKSRKSEPEAAERLLSQLCYL